MATLVGGLVTVGALAGTGMYLAAVGLDGADRPAGMIGLFLAVAGLGVAVYGLVANRRAGRRPPSGEHSSERGDPPVKQVTVWGSHGFVIGDNAHLTNIRRVDVPAALWASLVTLIASVLVVGAGWLYLGWFSPNFAPNYRTLFLVDTAENADPAGLTAVTTSLRKAIENSGDHDALSLRRFGGECGVPGNTAALAAFGTGDRQKITAAAARIRAGGRPTLVRGIVEAVEDFSKPLASKARQVNRIIVVTRHGVDACEDDPTYVEREIRERIGSGGLSLEFRLVGYQVPAAQRARLDRLAAATKAPRPVHVKTAPDLARTLDWYANTEPVLKGARSIVDTLNTTVTQVNTAVQAIVDGRLDVADSTLGQARKRGGGTSAQFDDLTGRTKGADARDVRDRAVRLRQKQKQVIAAASDLLKAARDGSPLDPKLALFQQAATDYNREVNGMNQALATLRAKLTKTHD
ncbi:VWA domain-containing protein [Actinomadura sp. KC216]|uniref:VWA domain-containing protein n=1 Tax=Actinomadura sp. KC216 TaxID=2530370 RepID=UPI00104FFA8E|nr:VWA domain-containing protein [Actinomadura sp. KC216]TDB83273.1 VWA domain-containing protein [Actinomadura sp. KC216]